METYFRITISAFEINEQKQIINNKRFFIIRFFTQDIKGRITKKNVE